MIRKLLNKRRKKYIGTPLQGKTMILVFLAAVVPTAIVGLCLYYIIFNLLAWQLGIPEAVAYNLIPVARQVNMIIVIALPLTLFVIWYMALELSNRIAGPLYRIEKELDDIIAGKKIGPIHVREKDELRTLVDKINKVIIK